MCASFVIVRLESPIATFEVRFVWLAQEVKESAIRTGNGAAVGCMVGCVQRGRGRRLIERLRGCGMRHSHRWRLRYCENEWFVVSRSGMELWSLEKQRRIVNGKMAQDLGSARTKTR
jgi:hypothetical protein